MIFRHYRKIGPVSVPFPTNTASYWFSAFWNIGRLNKSRIAHKQRSRRVAFALLCLTRHWLGSQPNAIDWGQGGWQNVPLSPQPTLEVKRRSETGETVFENSRHLIPDKYFRIIVTCRVKVESKVKIQRFRILDPWVRRTGRKELICAAICLRMIRH